MASVLRFDDWETTLGTSVAETDGSGNVAIGGSSPSYKLDVTGDINASGDIKLGGTSLGRGILARAESTSDFTITTGGVEILNTTFTVPAGRQVLLYGIVPLIDNASTTQYVRVAIESATAGGAGTIYNEVWEQNTSATYRSVVVSVVWASFGAGTHTVYLNAEVSTGTARANGAGGARRHQLFVMDVGPQ